MNKPWSNNYKEAATKSKYSVKESNIQEMTDGGNFLMFNPSSDSKEDDSDYTEDNVNDDSFDEDKHSYYDDKDEDEDKDKDSCNNEHSCDQYE